MPVTVAVDATGNALHESGPRELARKDREDTSNGSLKAEEHLALFASWYSPLPLEKARRWLAP
jgi:hypothetical protein